MPQIRSWRHLALILILLALASHQPGLAQQSPAPGLQNRLQDLFKPKEDELLPPERAFRMEASLQAPSLVQVDLIPASGYYLYRERIHFAIKDSRGVSIKGVRLPAGKLKKDPTFGTTQTYEVPVRAEVALERTPPAGSFTLVASYQGCHEKTGVCYPPITREVKLTLPALK